jgi:hypothetical protein
MVASILSVVTFEAFTIWRVVKSSLPHKWRWILLALVGIGAGQVLWETGEFAYQLLNISLAGFGVTARSTTGPWIVSVSFPIGAILTMRRLNSGLNEPRADA